MIGVSIRVSESNNALGLYEVYCVKEGAIDTSSIRSLDTKVTQRYANVPEFALDAVRRASITPLGLGCTIDDKIENRHQCWKGI